MSPPNPTPNHDERHKYEVDKKSREIVKDWPSWYLPILQTMTHAITLMKVALILTCSYPSLFSQTPFSALVTNPVLSRLRTTPIFLIGSALTYAPTFLCVQCYRTLGRQYTFQLAVLPHHKLVTSGPYAFVRHPGYTAGVLVNLGIAFCQVGSGSFLRDIVMPPASGSSILAICRSIVGPIWACLITAVSCFGIARPPKEDLVLRREFVEEWDRWAAGTKYRLIPGIY